MATMSNRAWWHEMMNKAARHLAEVSGRSMPETEDEVKCIVMHCLRHGTCAEAAEAVVEAAEWACAYDNVVHMDELGIV